MENNSRLFYMGIAYGAYPEPGARLVKNGLPVKKLERAFPYFLGTEHMAVRAVNRTAGKLQIYHALLPEYCGKTFFGSKPKSWKKETAGRLMKEVRERAMVKWDCREQLWAPELGKKEGELVPELFAVCLYRCRLFDRIYVTLEEEDGEYGLRQAMYLLLPYLPRLRLVFYVGKESEPSLLLESWLYGEFGIVMMRSEKAASDWPWLDLRKVSCDNSNLESEAVPACGNDFRHINHQETLKFLDTAVKNGYNTKVN